MAGQVDAILCNAMGGNSTTYCSLHDQSLPTTGKYVMDLPKLM